MSHICRCIHVVARMCHVWCVWCDMPHWHVICRCIHLVAHDATYDASHAAMHMRTNRNTPYVYAFVCHMSSHLCIHAYSGAARHMSIQRRMWMKRRITYSRQSYVNVWRWQVASYVTRMSVCVFIHVLHGWTYVYSFTHHIVLRNTNITVYSFAPYGAKDMWTYCATQIMYVRWECIDVCSDAMCIAQVCSRMLHE